MSTAELLLVWRLFRVDATRNRKRIGLTVMAIAWGTLSIVLLLSFVYSAGTLTLRTPLTNSNARTGLNIGFSNGASNSFSLANDFASMGFGSPNFIGSSAFVNDAFVAALPSSGFGGSGFLFNGHASPSVTFASFNNGSTTPFNGRVSVTINITSESRAGLVTGDVSVGSIGFFNFTGVIKAKKVTLVFSDGSGFISGKVSQAGLVLNGNFADDAFFDTTRGTIRVVRNG